jgi:hypothetical protein
VVAQQFKYLPLVLVLTQLLPTVKQSLFAWLEVGQAETEAEAVLG